jgi:23S rRNA pseudouridine1911/1915/1917 synthase
MKQHLTPVFHRQALQARRLGLVHPGSGEPCEWTVPLASDFAELIARAGIAEPGDDNDLDDDLDA